MLGWGKKKIAHPMKNCWLIDFEKLFKKIPEAKEDYREGSPFPHIVIEDLIDSSCIDKLLEEFPTSKQKIKWHDRKAILENGNYASYNKNDTADLLNLGPTTRQLLWELNSRPFLQFLQKLSGIRRLISDPLYYGGGLHQTLPGGLLQVHADFEKHPIYQLDRRMNVILYLNRDWPEEYGGNLELWDSAMKRCERSISPQAGRCVVFNTDRTSFHGHPQPLTCPEGRTRKSLALYYYTNGLNNEQRAPVGVTHWKP